jgi:large subunit ribosomal protein L7/L12
MASSQPLVVVLSWSQLALLMLVLLKKKKTEFDVVLTGFGDKKLNVVKVVKNLTGASLMEAKKMVEGVPATLKEGVAKEDADKIKAEIEEAGGSVELK